MTFSSAVTKRIDTDGGRKIYLGTFTNGANDTGGNINTGLTRVTSMRLQHTGSAVVSGVPVIDETITEAAPADGTAITIVTTKAKSGVWRAVGI